MKLFVTVITVSCLIGLCGSLNALHAETVAERFGQAMKKKAEYCRTHKIDPANRRCDILKLKPANPLATEEGRFALSIKIPNPLPEDSGYKPGMTAEQYFDQLCKKEAGEFIYKTVEDVDGLFVMRPREHPTDDQLGHLYALEDPYGDIDTGATKPQDYLIQPPFGRYEFLEAPLSHNGTPTPPRITRFFRGNPESSKKEFVVMKDSHSERVPYVVQSEVGEVSKSQYGYTWRGITRPHDREFGIAGSELLLLDLKTNEVLGVQRRFIRSGGVRDNPTGIWWLSAQVCEQFGGKKLYTTEFISKVLKPKNTAPSGKQTEGGAR